MTAISVMQALAQTPAPPPLPPPAASGDMFANVLVIAIAAATVISLVLIYLHVRGASHWSLSDALSEETDIPVPLYKGQDLVMLGEKIAVERQMKASSSRLIALLGTIAILMLYIGAGLTVLRKFAIDYTIPDGTVDLGYFLLTGLILFAPYIVNKFSSVFGWLRPAGAG